LKVSPPVFRRRFCFYLARKNEAGAQTAERRRLGFPNRRLPVRLTIRILSGKPDENTDRYTLA
jgi:hypothetical protein